MNEQWRTLEQKIDAQRFEHVMDRLNHQHENAIEWRDTCLTYFAQFAQLDE